MNVKLISLLAAGLLSAGPAFSATVTVDFEGIPSTSSVSNFYNGGGGPNYGISFGLDAVAFSNDAFTTYYSNAPSPGATMAPVGTDAAMNVANGFTGTASFFYSSSAVTSVSIYSGLNGTGTLLGTFSLLANANAGGCSDAPFCHWDLTSVSFDGVAKSIQFGGAYDGVNLTTLAGFDNVTVNAVPLPAALWMMVSGLGGLGAMIRRKRAVGAA